MEQHATRESVPPGYHAETTAAGISPGLGRLLSDLFRQSASLVHNEAQLVKAEMSEKFSQVGAGAGSLAAAMVLGNAALIILLAAAVIGLAEVMPAWLAALAVGLVTALIAYAFLSKGRRNLKARNLAPRESADSLRKDAQLLKEHVR